MITDIATTPLFATPALPSHAVAGADTVSGFRRALREERRASGTPDDARRRRRRVTRRWHGARSGFSLQSVASCEPRDPLASLANLLRVAPVLGGSHRSRSSAANPTGAALSAFFPLRLPFPGSAATSCLKETFVIRIYFPLRGLRLPWEHEYCVGDSSSQERKARSRRVKLRLLVQPEEENGTQKRIKTNPVRCI